MSRPAIFCAAIIITSAIATRAAAGDSKVVITVERPKPAAEKPACPPFVGNRPSVDVALLLDTSNSMDGLIHQAKSQLWMIVQQFAKAKKNGQTPVFRAALFEYGNTRLPAAEGYIRQVVPLSDDLDKLSEALFALATSGGDEYCGQVIDEAVTRLDWSKEANGYKAIFIAGNEPFTQGPVDYRSACKRAIERGIVVNTIHCGQTSEGINGHWQDGARLAEGEFFNIDQDRAVVQVRCPQDEIIIKLNTELNKTYLWYGAKDERRHYEANQAAQDANAYSLSTPTAAARVATKASGVYSNEKRDLVDASRHDATILTKLKAEELPDTLKEMTPAQRDARVKEMAAQRAEVQKKITELAVERDSYLAKQRQAQSAGDATLGDAVVSTIRKQLTKSGFDTATE
ncbi:MAG TPA: vWA domain-containing protein [Pirellulales bacterium]|nr:vWA domain-containing protein [Pirellulales bacterium]